jgi:hypothetical protein
MLTSDSPYDRIEICGQKLSSDKSGKNQEFNDAIIAQQQSFLGWTVQSTEVNSFLLIPPKTHTYENISVSLDGRGIVIGNFKHGWQTWTPGAVLQHLKTEHWRPHPRRVPVHWVASFLNGVFVLQIPAMDPAWRIEELRASKETTLTPQLPKTTSSKIENSSQSKQWRIISVEASAFDDKEYKQECGSRTFF